MSPRDLEDLLERIEDTKEIVLGPSAHDDAIGDLHAVWVDARHVARQAYEYWRAHPGAESYSVSRAAADRVDAAEDALARASLRPAA